MLARLNTTPLHLRLLIGFGLVLALSGAQSIFAYRTAAERVVAAEAQHTSEQIVVVADASRTALLEMEAGYRGYLLSGDESLLVSYRTAAVAFSKDLAQLRVLTVADPQDALDWQQLERRVAVWQQDIIEPGIAQRQAGTVAPADVSGFTSSALSQQDIEGIHRLLEAVIALEEADLEQTKVAAADSDNRFMAVLLWGTLAVFAVGLPVAGLAARNLAGAIDKVHAGDARYRQMFEHNEATQFVLDVKTGDLLDVNPAACAFYGYPREAMLHMNVTDLNTLRPAEQAEELSAAARGARASFQRRQILASGETRDVEIHTSLGEMNGRQVLYAIVHDVSERKQAEAAQQRSEARYRQMFEANPATQLVLEINTGALLEVNAAACNFYGYTREAMLRMHVTDLNPLHGAEQARELASVAQGARSFERRHVLASGELRDVEVQTSLNEVDGRQVVYSIIHDVTARKRVEVALGISEERNRLALAAAGMGTWDVDFVRHTHTWSVETEALFGLAPGTFGRNFEAFQRLVHPDDWPAFLLEDAAAKAARRNSITTYRTIWPDGSVHWIEENGLPYYAADGTTLLRMTGTSMDVTERKRAEEALRASEERFRKQYKGFPLPTCSWLREDDDFVLLEYNDAAEMIDEGRISECVGERASDYFADYPEIMADLRACVADQRPIRRETDFSYKSAGPPRQLAFTYVFVPPQTVMVHTEDITAAKQADQQREAMAQSEKLRALGQMASGIAHDLNQSLMLVASYSDLARQALMLDPPDLAELGDLLTTTTQAALDGGETVKRLLLFTRATPEHHAKRMDLSTVIREAAQLTAPRWRDAAQAEGRPISLHVEAEGHPSIQGSPARLRELLTNLIFNAVDALPSGGLIRLRVLAEDGQGVVEVIDSGVGMSTEVQARVFEPFFTTKGEGGTGLGLAMVFGIVEQHGGHIGVRSAPGEGTTLRITFPLLEALDEATEALSKVAQMSSGQLAPPCALRVLAVDDEPMITRAVVRMLKPAGHVVSVAGSGEEALEKLAAQAFDVVVSDMGMGAGMNGWDLAEAVRIRWPSIRFMLATGWGAALDPVEARRKGVEAVLSKPFHPTELLEVLARTDNAA